MGNLKNRKRPIQEEAQKLKFETVIAKNFEIKYSRPIFDGLTKKL